MTTTSNILRYNPYDIEFWRLPNIERAKREEFFFEHIFVETKAFRQYSDELLSGIDPNSNAFKNIIILHGYSGNGKTTFLNWFKRNLSSDFLFDIFNINNLPASNNDNVITQAVYVRLMKEITENGFLSLDFYQKHREIDRTFLTTEQIKFLTDYNQLIKDQKQLIECEIDNASKCIEIDSFLENFVNVFDFKSALFIYILEIIIKNKEHKYESITVAFDNLDEISFEYMTEQLWTDFQDVRSSLMRFFDNDETFFDFSRKFVLLLVFREANLLINASHHEERLEHNRKKIKLLLSDNEQAKAASGKKVIERRLEYLRRTRNVNNDNVYKVANAIVREDYTNRVFFPLFNYDYRKLMNMVIGIAKPDFLGHDTINPGMYKRIARIKPYIARGVFIHRIIKYLIDEKYIMPLAPRPDSSIINDMGYCRPSRMLLTLIFRYSFPNGIPKNERLMHLEKPKKFSIMEIIKEYFKIFDDSYEFFRNLLLFFDIERGSWAHMVSIYNKRINKNNYKLSFERETELVSRWHNEEIDYSDLNHAIRKEEQIELHINASGFIYLRYLITHFEYFVNLINERDEHRDMPSLLESFYNLTFLPPMGKYQFEIIIELVLEKLSRYRKNIFSFMQKHIKEQKNITPQAYLNSNFAFKRTAQHNSSFYFTRVVTTHISYIEDLREYMFKGRKKTISKEAKRQNHSLKDINSKILSFIEKYVALLKECKNDNIDVVARTAINKNEEGLLRVRNSPMHEWHPIDPSKNP